MMRNLKIKGFTLIELLVVIGIMAVIAAGVIALINPLEKTRQANDANVQNAIGQVATAMQSFAAQTTNGAYPTVAQWSAWDATNILVTSGELVALPVLPTGYNPGYSGGGAAAAAVYVNLVSAKYVTRCGALGAPYWFFATGNGKACGFCGAAVPGAASGCNMP